MRVPRNNQNIAKMWVAMIAVFVGWKVFSVNIFLDLRNQEATGSLEFWGMHLLACEKGYGFL